MKSWLRGVVVVGLFLMAASSTARADWAEYKSDKFGFSMQVPAGTKLADKQLGGGWGGLYANVSGVELFGLAKLNTQATPAEIEAFGVQATGIPGGAWKQIKKGENSNGWKWYRVAEASKGDQVVFAGYGTGPKGSYLLFVRTTKSDVAANRASYEKFYNSLTVF